MIGIEFRRIALAQGFLPPPQLETGKPAPAQPPGCADEGTGRARTLVAPGADQWNDRPPGTGLPERQSGERAAPRDGAAHGTQLFTI